ncbi:hypothetical protein JJB09_04685 [Rhizobium sp. KVB221]|uniref:Uncharacterized protein n=1 Tax=Rhizobium setariae TaxID=2801340 RepID=A0A937CL77_9HYPH|nr:hypothetical protein [Rhizobium setariae]MBL0371316.1 hypothetical protein [Rhizobium setariae]
MSSVVFLPHLTSLNLQMLGRVLDTAGIFNIDTAWHLERRMRFGRFLVDAFEEGITSEAELVASLEERLDVLDASCLPDAVMRDSRSDNVGWEHEGDSLGRTSDWASYLFGKRTEQDGSWTIYHVFSGLPAQYGTWNMQGLTEQEAERALRTINTPSFSGEH